MKGGPTPLQNGKKPIQISTQHETSTLEFCLNVESGRLLEEVTFECGNVGKNMFGRIKYC